LAADKVVVASLMFVVEEFVGLMADVVSAIGSAFAGL
jgi:hypothetical protein